MKCTRGKAGISSNDPIIIQRPRPLQFSEGFSCLKEEGAALAARPPAPVRRKARGPIRLGDLHNDFKSSSPAVIMTYEERLSLSFSACLPGEAADRLPSGRLSKSGSSAADEY